MYVCSEEVCQTWKFGSSLCIVPPVSGADSDCPLSELLQFSSSEGDIESEIPLDDACIPSEEPSGMCTFQFREGSVTYSGNTSGSIAFYNISDAYCVNSTTERVCDAGMWLNEVILEKGRLVN